MLIVIVPKEADSFGSDGISLKKNSKFFTGYFCQNLSIKPERYKFLEHKTYFSEFDCQNFASNILNDIRDIHDLIFYLQTKSIS